MSTFVRLAITVLVLLISHRLFGAAANTDKLELGIDRSGLSMQPETVQLKTLGDISALHATWFRDGPSSGTPQGVANFVKEVRIAKQHNLKFLVNIVQMDEDYDIPLAMHEHGWKIKKLSQINLNKFSQRFRNLLGALKAANLTIDAVEFGNEDDSYYYDADVPNGHAATPAELQVWLHGYGEFLKTGALVLHDSHYYPQAKIITFGIAHNSDQYDNPPHHLSNPASIVAMLKNVNGVNYLDNTSYHVDAFGTHVYASPNGVDESATTILRQDIWALGRNRPLWVTEFGFLDKNAFPNKKGQSLSAAIDEFMATFTTMSQRIPFGPVMFYSYNGWLADSLGKVLPEAQVLSKHGQVMQGVQ